MARTERFTARGVEEADAPESNRTDVERHPTIRTARGTLLRKRPLNTHNCRTARSTSRLRISKQTDTEDHEYALEVTLRVVSHSLVHQLPGHPDERARFLQMKLCVHFLEFEVSLDRG